MRWQILLNDISHGGFSPRFYAETYPSYGNKNQAGAMTNIDMTNAGFISQGPGLVNLTNGTQAGALTTLPKGVLDFAVTSDATYGVGGAKLYKLSSTTLTSDATWPHTIDKAAQTAEDGEDVALYQSNLYYSYNHSNTLGDVGKYNLDATFDDDWGSTVPSGAATLTGGVPHPMVVAGNDTLYIGNGRYVTSYNGTTFIQQALDLPTGAIIQSMRWMSDRLWIAANRSSLTGNNKNEASIFVWDGTTDSWEAEIKLMGTVGAMHVKNGILFVFYQDITSSGGYKLAYVSGSNITDLSNFTGGLPAFYQVTDYKDFILWNAGGSIWAFGSGDKDLPNRLFQIADGGYTTVGGLACPFGTPIVASFDGATNYRIAKFSGYDTNSSWKSTMFDVTGAERNTGIDSVRINFEALESGARVDWSLKNNKGTTIYSDTISYAKLGADTTAFYPLNGKVAENFRVEFDYTNGDTTNTVKLKNVKIYGGSK